jgi:hypothetical protein
VLVEQANVLDAEYGMKHTSLPGVVLCEETYNPKLGKYERK